MSGQNKSRSGDMRSLLSRLQEGRVLLDTVRFRRQISEPLVSIITKTRFKWPTCSRESIVIVRRSSGSVFISAFHSYDLFFAIRRVTISAKAYAFHVAGFISVVIIWQLFSTPPAIVLLIWWASCIIWNIPILTLPDCVTKTVSGVRLARALPCRSRKWIPSMICNFLDGKTDQHAVIFTYWSDNCNDFTCGDHAFAGQDLADRDLYRFPNKEDRIIVMVGFLQIQKATMV